MDSLEVLKYDLIKVIELAGIPINENQIEIIDRSVPHKKFLKIPEGQVLIYNFELNGEFLKIGKAGAKSNPRVYQHYSPNSSISNLAKSLINDIEMKKYNLNETNVGNWMQENLRRIECYVDLSLGVFVLNLIEAFLHCKYQPRYEGFKSQR